MSPTLEEAAVLDVQDIQGQVDELSQLPFKTSDEPFEPLPFEYAAMPDHLIQFPPLDERWSATYEGDLFGIPQTLEHTIQNDASLLGENVGMTLQVASSSQPPTGVAPIKHEDQQHLPGDERPNHAHPPIQLTLVGSKAALEQARRRRQANRRRRGPKPAVEVDWLPRDADRETKDRFLVEARRNKVSYKLIKTYGRFAEAESTLRGRFRTLTKRKEDRVRDPQWTPIDVSFSVSLFCPFVINFSWMA